MTAAVHSLRFEHRSALLNISECEREIIDLQKLSQKLFEAIEKERARIDELRNDAACYLAAINQLENSEKTMAALAPREASNVQH